MKRLLLGRAAPQWKCIMTLPMTIIVTNKPMPKMNSRMKNPNPIKSMTARRPKTKAMRIKKRSIPSTKTHPRRAAKARHTTVTFGGAYSADETDAIMP